MNNLEDRIYFLNAAERVRLAAWLQFEQKPDRFNKGRWQQILDLSSDYISCKELRLLSDYIQPFGFAYQVITGECNLRVLKNDNA